MKFKSFIWVKIESLQLFVFCLLSCLCFGVVDLSGYRCRTECMEDGEIFAGRPDITLGTDSIGASL